MAEGGGPEIINLIQESPPKNLSLDDIVIIQKKFQDLAMFHTIALSDSIEMKIQNIDEKTIESQVRATIEKAFWNILQEDLDKDPPEYKQSLILLQEIKKELMGLLLNGSKSQQIKQRIDEILDVDLIQQQISNSVFNFQPYSNFIIETMARMCSPGRDDLIASLKNITSIVPLYKKIYEVLNIMHVDFSNFEMKAMQPIIKSHSVEAERDLFFNILNFQREKGIDGLLITKEWLKMNISYLRKNQIDKSSDNSSNNSMLKVVDVLNVAYVDLLQKEYYPLPETVALDKIFIDNMRKEISKVSFISAVIALTRSTYSEHLIHETMRKQLKDNLIILCQDFGLISNDCQTRETWARGVGEHILDTLKNDWIALNSSQDSSNIPFFDENKKIDFISQIIAFIDAEMRHPILDLMVNRLMTFLLDAIQNNTKEKIPLPIGFNLFSMELLDITAQFKHVFDYNRKVFAPIYDNLIKHLISNQLV